MEKERRIVVLPYDGYSNQEEVLAVMRNDLRDRSLSASLAFFKVNDAIFAAPYSAPAFFEMIHALLEQYGFEGRIKLFLDLKLADTSGTVGNVVKHFGTDFDGILTVRSNLSGKGYQEIRRMFPKAMIALVSFLTDNSEQDCLEQYGMFPDEKILHDMRIVQRKYERVREDCDPKYAFDAVVSSPNEVEYISRNEVHVLGKVFIKITPGIRDDWMARGQQNRIAGIFKALTMGINYAVMGSQLKKGNPGKGISAAESLNLTLDEIERFYSEQEK